MINKVLRTLTALLVCCCLLLSAFSGSAIAAQAAELGTGTPVQLRTDNSTDTAVQIRIRNFYDTITFSSARNCIDDAIEFANTVYGELFSIAITRHGNISADTITDLTDCLLADEAPCRTASGCGHERDHHKDIGRIADDLYEWHSENYTDDEENNRSVTVLWTSYEGVYCEYVCVNDSWTHHYRNYGAVVFGYRPVIHIMDIATGTESRYAAHMSFLLAHELTHCHGYDDVYDNDNIANNSCHEYDSSYECLMDYFDVMLLSTTTANTIYDNWRRTPENAFCSECQEELQFWLDGW